MNLQDLLRLYEAHPKVNAALRLLEEAPDTPLMLRHLSGSAVALVMGALFTRSRRNMVLVHDDADQAAYLYFDLAQFFGKDNVLYLPASFRHSVRYGQEDSGNRLLRTEVLGALRRPEPKIIVASPESLIEKVIDGDELDRRTLRLHVGEQVDTAFITGLLGEFGFQNTDYVYEPGQFAVRGSLIDVYSWSYEYPYRIDFFGDEVESIRSFDVETQLSKDRFDEIEIMPQSQLGENDRAVPVSDYFAPDTLMGFNDADYCLRQMDRMCQEVPEGAARCHLLDGSAFFEGLTQRFACLEFGAQGHFDRLAAIDFRCLPQEPFGKNFDYASQRIGQLLAEGKRMFLLSNNARQTERVRSIFAERGSVEFTAVDDTLHEGFLDQDLDILCYTDHQLFDRFHKYSLRSDKARSGKMALTLKELMQFQYGDYVVHLDHGIGRFGGLFKTTINGKEQEVMKIMYKDNDVILVSIHSLDRVTKYRGKEGEEPVIHKLSSGAWDKIKERSKKKIKDIARDLIQLYAARMQEKGFAYGPDTYLQEALEASFIYEETPDQNKAIADVKRDMESDRPMDRLVCGDVGFGKTEIAIRAAFKAVADGKQVAVLVPTTVLALQHYNTFCERLRDLPCTVDYLSRTRSAADVKKLLSELPQGKPDILIGTHKLVGKDVHFKDLGLLIIDEEQKFGVSVKEKLRQMKTQVDTLTLTATPIPRTLQFSLMGARDLSSLTTPPANRYPIQTEVCPFDKEVIRDGIMLELERNGQVFFVTNRIADLPNLEAIVRQVAPQARTAIAHGQMEGEKLEKIIVDFINHEYDVLICTSIVENGVDIPNVNTIFVNSAQKFGLSDLHQLRGRVGRTNRKAFCYLLAPPDEYLSADARRRLQAIESFSELGSGMSIALQDLDIRGAGNMLGAEQSGFIADLGFETYQRILKEAVFELKNEEFSDLYHPAPESPANTGADYVADCQLEADLALYFDETYIPGSGERMSLYREMDQLADEAAVDAFEKRLLDRFGPMPREGRDLLDLTRIKLLAKRLGMEKVVLKNGQMICYFVRNLESPYYQSEAFDGILLYAQEHFRTTRLREVQGRRSMVVAPVADTDAAFTALKAMAKDSAAGQTA